MLCDVALGNVFRAKCNGYNPDTKKIGWTADVVERVVLNKGFDTVVARNDVRGINYDETVVYESGQGTPSYIVVYDKPNAGELKRRGNESFRQKDYAAAVSQRARRAMAGPHALSVQVLDILDSISCILDSTECVTLSTIGRACGPVDCSLLSLESMFL